IDLTTGAATILSNNVNSWATGLTYGPDGLLVKVGNEVHGLIPNDSSTYIDTITNDEGIELHSIFHYDAFAGTYYGIYRDGSDTSILYSIDSSVWEATVVFDTTIPNISALTNGPDQFAPAGVTDLAIDEDLSGCNYATLTWTDPDDTDLDFIMVTWSPNGPAKPIVVQDGNEILSPILDITPETEYTFTVRTVDIEGNMSEGVTFTVTSPACPVIAAPTHPLYLLTGADYTNSVTGLLYTLDPLTLETTFIGDTGLKSTAGLAINPLDGKMYVTSNETRHLYEIDPATAEVITDIGALGTGNVPDLTFGADGTLYGWDRNNDDLVTIDLTTGAATIVGDSGYSSWGVGIAFDGDTLIVKSQDTIYTADTTTGALTEVDPVTGILTFPDDFYWLGNVLAISDNDYYYTVQRDDYPGGNSYLYVINPDDNKATFLGDLGIIGVSALEFDKH
ncbi:MAG TPA: hypothetical protein P5077_09555, partial [bacterium]|nr:hypothetical protein [bacterium]